MEQHTEFMDPVTDVMLNKINPKVHEGMTAEQLLAVRDAIRDVVWKKKHFADFRGVVSLYFVRIYYSFFMGMDRRGGHQTTESERRIASSATKNVIFLTLFLTYVLGFIGLTIYTIYVAYQRGIFDFLN